MSRRSVDRTALLAFVLAVLVLGANAVGIRFTNRELAPFAGAVVRFVPACALLFAIVAVRRIALPRGRALAGAVAFGVGQYFFVFALIYWGLVDVSAGMFSVVFATMPLWTILLSSAAGFERLRARSVVGMVVAVAGLGIVFAEQLSPSVPLVRVAAIVASAFIAGVTGVIVKAFPRTSPVATNAIGTLVGTPLLFLASLLLGEPWAVPQQTATWLALAFLVVTTVAGFIAITFVVVRWTPSAAAYQVLLSPIVTVILAALLEGEVFETGFFLGGAVVAVGVVIGAVSTTRPRSAASEIAAAE